MRRPGRDELNTRPTGRHDREPEPPSWMERLLHRHLPAGTRGASILGDMREEFIQDHRDVGRARACLRYFRNVLSITACFAGRNCSNQSSSRNVTTPRKTPVVVLSGILQDIRYALRSLVKNPAFALVAVLTLALGIGANTAVFSVLDGILLKPLHYEDPDRLVRIYQTHPTSAPTGSVVSGPAFLDYRDLTGAFDNIAGMYDLVETGFTLTGHGRPQRVVMLPVTANYFDVYAVEPLIGRKFLPEEQRDSPRVVILSFRLWNSIAGGDNDIIGETVTLDDVDYEVVGVLPESFRDVVGGDVDLWSPMDLAVAANRTRGNHYITVIARLSAGVTVEEAQTQLDVVSARQAELYPIPHTDWKALIVPLHSDVVGDVGEMLYILMAAAGLVLLIACVNVANLLMARNVAREHELAVRSALGSGRLRLVQLFLIESIIIAVVGAFAGLVMAHWGVSSLLALAPDSLPRSGGITPDATLLGFALGVTALTVMLFSLGPTLRFAGTRPVQPVRHLSRSTAGIRAAVLRKGLVIVQVTLAVLLLVGAGLLMKSFINLHQTRLGIAPQHAMTFRVHLPEPRYADPALRTSFFQEYHDRLEAIAGVSAVGAVSWLPVSGEYNSWGFRHRTSDGDVVWKSANFRIVEGGYFEALNINLVSGRYFTRSDNPESPHVAMVNEAFVRQYYEGRDPLTEEFGAEGRRWSVVGVVNDVAHDHRGSIAPKVYLPHAQFAYDRNWALTQIISTTTARDDILDVARRELAAIDPDLVLHYPRSMRDVMGTAIARETFVFVLMCVFGALALSLAAAGIYGVLAYSVHQRTREIGIRMALGADGQAVRWNVVRQGVLLSGTGIVAGLAVAFILSGVLQSLLFNVGVRDPFTFLTVPVALVVVACLAAYVPARHASRVDPIEAIRYE